VVGFPFTSDFMGYSSFICGQEIFFFFKGMITANIPFSERNKSAASINLQRHGVKKTRSLLVIRFVIFGIKWVGTIKVFVFGSSTNSSKPA
jgi:hypothetical protein